MGFQEKSAWACLLGIVVVFVPYFVAVFQYPAAFVGLFGLAVVALVVLLVVFHSVNALLTRSIRRSGDTPPRDEMDRLIELRAAKLSGAVLSGAVFVWMLGALFGVPVMAAGSGAAPLSIPLVQALAAVHLLFAGFVFANLAYYGSIIAGYRRLASG